MKIDPRKDLKRKNTTEYRRFIFIESGNRKDCGFEVTERSADILFLPGIDLEIIIFANIKSYFKSTTYKKANTETNDISNYKNIVINE